MTAMRYKGKKQRGVAMIEMVMVTPLMLLLVLGVAEVGKALVQYTALTKNVRDAARLVAGRALLGTTGTVMITPELIAQAANIASFGNVAGVGDPLLPSLSPAQVSVTDAGNDMVLVQVNYPYEPLFGPILETFGYGTEPNTAITLTASVTMRAL
jgi:Flp pilus assembly protein TadG